jgi:uncharacterized protein YbjQ (UPF0145 family)
MPIYPIEEDEGGSCRATGPGLIVCGRSTGRVTSEDDQVASNCARCGAKKSFMDAMTTELGADRYLCSTCQQFENEEKRVSEAKRVKQIRQAAAKVIVTTTPKVDGTQVVAYLGIESVEFVIGTGVFSEITTSINDFFGARSSAFETKLRAAKNHAMAALKYIAAEKGANAVIGIDLDYTEFSGNRIALIINGTLVKLAPIASRPATKQPDPEV